MGRRGISRVRGRRDRYAIIGLRACPPWEDALQLSFRFG